MSVQESIQVFDFENWKYFAISFYESLIQMKKTFFGILIWSWKSNSNYRAAGDKSNLPNIDEKEVLDVSDDIDEADICQQVEVDNDETQKTTSSGDLTEKSECGLFSYNYLFLLFKIIPHYLSF